MIKMNEKAFTLIEIMAVISILAIVCLTLVPNFAPIVQKNKDKIYQSQVSEIERATEGYVAENVSELLTDEVTILQFTLEELRTLNVIPKKNIKNPKTEEVMNGCVTVSVDSNNQFKAKYVEEACSK